MIRKLTIEYEVLGKYSPDGGRVIGPEVSIIEMVSDEKQIVENMGFLAQSYLRMGLEQAELDSVE